jgi:hypothetical protein
MERRSSLPSINPNERMKFHLRKRKFSTNDLDPKNHLRIPPHELVEHFHDVKISPELPQQQRDNEISNEIQTHDILEEHRPTHPTHDHGIKNDLHQARESEKGHYDLTSGGFLNHHQSNKIQHTHSILVSPAPSLKLPSKKVIEMVTEEQVLLSSRAAKSSKPCECCSFL